MPLTLAARAGDHHRVVVQPCDGAVGSHDPVLDIERIARFVRSLRLRQHALAVVGVQHADPQPRIHQSLFGGVAGQPFVLRADV